MHCPECGTKANPGAVACATCGNVLPKDEHADQAPLLVGRTMVGVSGPAAAGPPPPPMEDLPTIVSPPKKSSQPDSPQASSSAGDDAPRARMPSQLQNTILGGIAPAELQALVPQPTNGAQKGAHGTILGGIAPTPKRTNDPKAPREMPHELGATLIPKQARPRPANRVGAERLDPEALLLHRDKLARKRVVLPPVRSREELARAEAQKRRRKAIPIVAGALGLLIVLLVIGLFFRSSSPISARVRVLPDGHQAVDITCPSCPDGTKVAIGDTTAVINSRAAQIPLVAPLSLGENRLKVAIDRPARGRDETIGIAVQVGYRLRPELSSLNADKPTLHVAIEALQGTEITIDGHVVKVDDGAKVQAIDVSAECTGSSDEPATLKRSIAYSTRAPDGSHDEGTVDIAVGIVPLRVDAPGPRVVTESDTFVLSGHTIKGAEVLVAGRPIQVSAEGAFAQRMSVSSIGATNIEVRAKIPGMAPRIVPIAVQRVERLEQAAKDFQKEKPVGYTTVALASSSDVGRPVIVAGQIAELRSQNHQTIYVLDVPSSEGCPKSNGCRIRLVQGSISAAKIGDTIIAYGQIGRPSAAAGGAALPEVQVAFTLPGSVRATP
ncbi:MAG TPA: zinc ribbon domain-containing protein [Polyangium sp.]|nr:zinc ribbon domain-containing protein [Polyangium sp.]